MVRPFLSSNFGNYEFFEQGGKFAKYAFRNKGGKQIAASL